MTIFKPAAVVSNLENMAERTLSTTSSTPESAAHAALKVVASHLHDSHRGYDIGRRQSSDRFLRIEFSELAAKRAEMAQDVDALLAKLGVEADPDGSTLGAVHRVMLDMQGKLFGRGRARVLREVVRGEGVLEEAYDDVLAEDIPAEASQLLKRHHRQVRATRDRYEAMLDEGEDAENPVDHSLAGRLSRLNKVITGNPILSAVVVTAASALTARLLSGRRRY
jgi:uncharacterized protein (TIGR02284 family)